MPDITMCDHTKTSEPERVCPRAKQCHRHVATPTPGRQSFFMRLPMLDDGSCERFWPDEEFDR